MPRPALEDGETARVCHHHHHYRHLCRQCRRRSRRFLPLLLLIIAAHFVTVTNTKAFVYS